MTQVHETHNHRDAVGRATGMMLVLAALLVAAVIAGVVLLLAQPWDDDGGTTPNVPGIEQPVGDGSNDAVPDAPEGGQ